MAISPIENIIFVNQNMQVAATKQLDFQSRVDFQNLVAGAIANDKEKEVEDIADLNEDVMIKEDLEHHKQNSDTSSGEKEEEEKAVINMAKKNKSNDIDEDDGLPHLLDIRV